MSVVMAAALAMSLSVTAAAAGKGDQNIDVTAKYQDNSTQAEVYSVDVQWGTMQFTYVESGSMVWNPIDHSYTDNTKTGWTASGNTVTVVNHSNAEVTATFSFEALEDYAGITGTFDVPTKTLQAGEVGGFDSADQVVSTLTIEGALADTVAEFTKIGAITVNIA